MLNFFVSCMVYAIESIVYFAIFSRLGKQKYSTPICLLIGLILFEFISGINLIFHNTAWINIITTIPITAFFSWLCFQKKIKTAFCYSILLATLELALEMIVILGTSSFIHVQVTEYNDNLALLILEFLACKAPFFLVAMLFSNIKSIEAQSKIPIALFIYPATSVCCLLAFWYISLLGLIDTKSQLLLSVCSGMLFIASIFLFHTFQEEMEKTGMLAMIQSENRHLKAEKDYYNILEQQNQNLLTYAHDARKHLSAIQELNSDPRIDEYVTNLCGQLKQYSQSSHCGNKLLDVIINRYHVDSELRGISFDYDVKECNLLGIDDMDLVAILSNLLDNAFTSAVESMEKKVSLSTTVRNSYHVIIIKNSCNKPPLSKDEKLLTTKEDKKIHGYGLKSVIKAAKKYSGDFYWTYNQENNIFTATVMLKIAAVIQAAANERSEETNQ